MELEQVVADARAASQELDAIMGPWCGTTRVAHLAGVVGRLTDDVLAHDGALPLPVEEERLAHNVADALYHLIALADAHQVDLGRSWSQFIQEGRAQLRDEGVVAALRETLSRNRNATHRA